MCSPDETRIMSPSAPLGEKKMNSFAFESGGKRSIALDSSHIDRTSEEIVLRDTDDEKEIRPSLARNRNHFQRSSKYCIAKINFIAQTISIASVMHN